MKRFPVKVAFHNKKGGVGKSTLCRSLAAALQMLGRRVLVIDGDAPQWTSAGWFEDRKKELGDKAALMPPVDVRETPGVLHVMAVQSPSQADCSGQWEYVFYDLPGRVDAETRAVLVNVDLAVVPVRPTHDDVACLSQTLDLIQKAGLARRRPLPAYVVLNALRRGTRAARLFEEGQGLTLPPGVKMLKAQIRDLADWPAARAFGLCPLELDKNGQAAKDLASLCAEFIEVSRREC